MFLGVITLTHYFMYSIIANFINSLTTKFFQKKKVHAKKKKIMTLGGFEPATSCIRVQCLANSAITLYWKIR